MKSTRHFHFWAICTAVCYVAMAATWNQYVIITNIISSQVLIIVLLGQLDNTFHAAHVTFYVLSCVAIMQIGPIGPAVVFSSKFYFSHGVFVVAQLVAVSKRKLNPNKSALHSALRYLGAGIVCVIGLMMFHVVYAMAVQAKSPMWLVHLTAAIANTPTDIESQFNSAAEQQPSAWASFYYDFQNLMILMPFGLYKLVVPSTISKQNVFVVVCTILSVVNAGVNVKGMALLAIPAAIVSAIALATIVPVHLNNAFPRIMSEKEKRKPGNESYSAKNKWVAWAVLVALLWMLTSFAMHATWVSSEAYSSPSILLTSRKADGSRFVMDDFRQAYAWIKESTPEDAKVMAWWDYGGQIATLTNRSVLASSVSGNDDQLSRIAQAFALPEDQAYNIVQELGATHVVVVFGGYVGYTADDLNKFTWMLRIASNTPAGANIKESDYLSARGIFRIDQGGTSAMTESLLYQLSYHRFATVYTDSGQPKGYDRVRRAAFGNKRFELNSFEEVYTSKHWLVRVYKVKEPHNRGLEWTTAQ